MNDGHGTISPELVKQWLSKINEAFEGGPAAVRCLQDMLESSQPETLFRAISLGHVLDACMEEAVRRFEDTTKKVLDELTAQVPS